MEKYTKRVKLTMTTDKSVERFKVIDSKNAADQLRKIIPEDSIDVHESCVAVFFNQSNESVGWFLISQGGINQSIVDVRMVMSAALGCLATGIIICHNHPSGSLNPSNADIRITEKLRGACDILDIKFLDHIILTEQSYYSFADSGLV